MKAINNTAVEVLPALLNKTKTSTIRKAWEISEHMESGAKGPITRPAKYKVGDIVPMVWDRHSPYNEFCTCHGIGYGSEGYRQKQHKDLTYFKRNLGDVEITEVFKIRMEEGRVMSYEMHSKIPVLLSYELVEDLAKEEGFESAEQMFEYFDKNYDLSTPREFWVYKFRWL